MRYRNDDLHADPLHRGRLRKRGRDVMIRGVHFLPSLATLGNGICGFAAIYVCTLSTNGETDQWAIMFAQHKMLWAAYLVFFAAIFDVLDGRLARLTRHTTDFGGQLDSLADVVSFGAAPAFVALQLFKIDGPQVPTSISRLTWAIGGFYLACAMMRLARFNVTNKHGEQHHRSFQGLPSQAAGLAVLSLVILHQQLVSDGFFGLAKAAATLGPVLLFGAALLMVSDVRYPHLINTAFKGRKSIWKLVASVMAILLLVVSPSYTISTTCLLFVLVGPAYWLRYRRQLQQQQLVAPEPDRVPPSDRLPPPAPLA